MRALRIFLAFTLFLLPAMAMQVIWTSACLAVWPVLTLLMFVRQETGFQKFFWSDFIIWPMAMFKSVVDSAYIVR